MGISAGWISVKGLGRGEFLARLRLTETDDTHSLVEYWLPRRSTGAVATLPNERELFVSRNGDLVALEVAERVSVGVELVMCWMDEDGLDSESYSFTNGKLDWLIRHDPKKSREHIETQGRLPASFAVALAKAEELDRIQGGADYYFDVPLDVAGPLGAFRADWDFRELSDFDGTVTLVERTDVKRSAVASLFRWLSRDVGH
jgi:hypothetical protein